MMSHYIGMIIYIYTNNLFLIRSSISRVVVGKLSYGLQQSVITPYCKGQSVAMTDALHQYTESKTAHGSNKPIQ